MRILHFYPGKDDMVTRYVDMLLNVMAEYVDSRKSTDLSELKKSIKQWKPDIIHLHGCWEFTTFMALIHADARNIRCVFTPHGQLEPWIMRQNYWREKYPKLFLYQRRILKKAYSIIAMGSMEANCIKNYGWNNRIETVRNPLITETITTVDVGCQVFAVYNKVLNSDVLKLMDDKTITALSVLIKAGQALDEKWISDKEYNIVKGIGQNDWSRLLLYSYQEEILSTVMKGATILQFIIPDIDFSSVSFYLPEKHHKSRPLSSKRNSDANMGFVTVVKAAHERMSHKKLTLSNVLELSSFLRTAIVQDDKIERYLREEELSEFAGRLMQVVADFTCLDVGFMPVTSINDRATRKIKRIITKHLEI